MYVVGVPERKNGDRKHQEPLAYGTKPQGIRLYSFCFPDLNIPGTA